ncbi:MAG: aspartate carbamoyltransferase catalytic subunit [Phycisphaerales bacterium]|nr:MAG: aspartate carbamoyltransferase catalytic subunit [Phycisphaerales bacterium]
MEARPTGSISRERDLLALRGMDAREIRRLVRLAADPAALREDENPLIGRIVANLFFEDSTRTRLSFSVAAQRLGARVVDLAGPGSSVSKGESLVDTALTVEAMGVSALVVRCKQSGGAELISRAVDIGVINAGDGRHEHPTQGLLDILTLARAAGRLSTLDFSGMTLAIVGDIESSRVARSNIAGMGALGARVVCVGPASMAPASLSTLGCEVSSDLDSILPSADAVMMLRIQFERHEDSARGAEGVPMKSSHESIREYRAGYALTRERHAVMKRGAFVMHPGPMNRGVEIDAEVADAPNSLILTQVARGVDVRMAVLLDRLRPELTRG